MSISNLRVGDLVYPAYDGKAGRCTACEITEVIDETTIKVKGNFWAGVYRETEAIFIYKQEEDEDRPLWRSWVTYDDQPTLMDLLGIGGEDGDYYSLYEPELLIEFCSEAYLKTLGLSK